MGIGLSEADTLAGGNLMNSIIREGLWVPTMSVPNRPVNIFDLVNVNFRLRVTEQVD